MKHGLNPAVCDMINERAPTRGVRHDEKEHVERLVTVRLHTRQTYALMLCPVGEMHEVVLPHAPAPRLDALPLVELGKKHGREDIGG